MPTPMPNTLALTPDQRDHLERIARTFTAPYGDVLRAKIILYAAAGQAHADIARRLDCDPRFVSTAQEHFVAHGLAGLSDHPLFGDPFPNSNADVTLGVSPVGLYPFGVPPASVLFDFAQAAERLGFASLWLGDHLTFITSPFMCQCWNPSPSSPLSRHALNV